MEYTEEQKAVINSNHQVTFVNAGAGTGKTTTMMAKLCHLLEDEKVKPESLLLCAFTNRDVNEMKRRFKKMNQRTSTEAQKGSVQIVTADKLIIGEIAKRIDSILGRQRHIVKDFEYYEALMQFVFNTLHINPQEHYSGAYEDLENHAESDRSVICALVDWCQMHCVTPVEIYSDIYERYFHGVSTFTLNESQKECYRRLKKAYQDAKDDAERTRVEEAYIEWTAHFTTDELLPKDLRRPLLMTMTKMNAMYLRHIVEDPLAPLIVNFENHHRLIELLFETYPKLTDIIHETLPYTRYIFIDEIQDYAPIQFDIFAIIAKTLNAKLNTLGDVDQCIYQFRGASPFYMSHHFLTQFDDVAELPLTKNYRMKSPKLKEIPNYILKTIGSEMQLTTAVEDEVEDDIWNPFEENDSVQTSREYLFSKTNTLFLPQEDDMMRHVIPMIEAIRRRNQHESIEILTRTSLLSNVIRSALKEADIPSIDLMTIKREIDTRTQSLTREASRRFTTGSNAPSIKYDDIRMGSLYYMLKDLKEVMEENGFNDQDEVNQALGIGMVNDMMDIFGKNYSYWAKKLTFTSYSIAQDDLCMIYDICQKLDTLIRDFISLSKQSEGLNCVELSTIHGFKGGEADYVFLLETPTKFDKNTDPSGEYNALYVAFTRAKKATFVVPNGRVFQPSELELLQLYKGQFVNVKGEERALTDVVNKDKGDANHED